MSAFVRNLLILSLFVAPGLHAGDCDDDPTVAPFIKAVKNDPKNLDHMYNLAIAYYKKATAVEPGSPNPCLDDAIDSMKRFSKAAASKGLKDKTLSDAYSVLGILQFQFKGDASGGLEAFEKAIELKPDDKESLYGAALANMKLGKNKEASEYFKKTVAVDPGNVNAAYNYATSLNTIYGDTPTPEQQAELRKAFEGAAKAGERNKKNNKDILVVTYNRLAELYGKVNEVPKAIEVLQKAIALEPNDFNAHGQLGLLYHRDKNYLKMVDEYETAIKIEPNQENARFNLAVAYINQEQFANAYKQFAYITEKINPSNSEVLALQAQTLERAITELKAAGTTAFTAEDYFTAHKDFEEVLALYPKDKEAQKYLDESSKQIDLKFAEFVKDGDKEAKKGRKVAAAEAYEKALALRPDDEATKKKRNKLGADISQLVKLYLAKGDKAFKAGDFFGAEENYNKAKGFKQGKDRAEAKLKKLGDKFKGDFSKALHRGNAALKENKLADALRAFRAALGINRNDKEANAGLVQTNVRISEQVKKWTASADDAAAAGKKSEATKLYNKILALVPDNANAAEKIKSLTGSESKVKVDADKVKTLYYQGVDFYVNNNISMAIKTWKDLLKLDPNHQDAIKNIQRAETKMKALEKLKG